MYLYKARKLPPTSIIVLCCLACVADVMGDHWVYPAPGINGEMVETEDWGGMCNSGHKQSPIDLAYGASIQGEFPDFKFIGYADPISNAQVTNNGHTIQIDVGASKEMILEGGGLERKYVLDQMHFHWGSEHTVNGRRYALELHMVHHDNRFPTINEALSVKNGVAVLGILFHVSTLANEQLENVLSGVEAIVERISESVTLARPFPAGAFLPMNTTSYFRYEGSLTTPTCAEAVTWTVFTQSLPISFDQIEKFKHVKTEAGTSLTNNFRSVQPLNARALVYVVPHDEALMERDGASFMAKPSILLALIVAVMGKLILPYH